MRRLLLSLLLTALFVQVFPVALMAADPREEARRFLEENAKKEGVVVTESGLQYRILAEGDGPRPTRNDIVAVYYDGRLPNGKVFDSAEIIHPPAVFKVDSLVKGWKEALELMPLGSVWELVLPPELAYGEKGNLPKIPPHAVLIFELELIAIF
jgi:FKBP-type peptidyl-prolyl cis-trans isomerase FklB